MFVLRLASLSALLFFVSPLWGADAVAPQTLRYTILSNGRAAGSEVDVYSPSGQIDCTFEFNDRGRGPKIVAHYLVAADGSPSRADVTGNDYVKAPVDEHFAVENGMAHWKSTSENAQAPAAGFYISNNGPAVESALLAGALLKTKGAPVKLLPAGEARLERLTDVSLEDHGRKLHVTEFAITGLSFGPQAVWLDDDQHFFGVSGQVVRHAKGGLGGDERSALCSRPRRRRHPQRPPGTSIGATPGSSTCRGACPPL